MTHSHTHHRHNPSPKQVTVFDAENLRVGFAYTKDEKAPLSLAGPIFAAIYRVTSLVLYVVILVCLARIFLHSTGWDGEEEGEGEGEEGEGQAEAAGPAAMVVEEEEEQQGEDDDDEEASSPCLRPHTHTGKGAVSGGGGGVRGWVSRWWPRPLRSSSFLPKSSSAASLCSQEADADGLASPPVVLLDGYAGGPLLRHHSHHHGGGETVGLPIPAYQAQSPHTSPTRRKRVGAGGAVAASKMQ